MFTRFSLDYGEIFAILVTCGGVASRIEVVGRWVFVVSGDLVVVESDYRIRVCWLLDCWIFSLIGYMLGGGFIFFVFLFFVSLCIAWFALLCVKLDCGPRSRMLCSGRCAPNRALDGSAFVGIEMY